MELFAHMNGTVIPLEEVKDDAFSQKVLGEGVAIEPEEGKLYSLCDGKIEMVFDLEGIHNEGYQTTTPLIICNTDDYSSVRSAGSRKISAGESLVEIILQVQ